MEEFRNEIIRELRKKLGEEYHVFPQDKCKNNRLYLHGICIQRGNGLMNPVMYLEEFILPYAAGKINAAGIADVLLERYRREAIPQAAAERLTDFDAMKEKIRIKVINYGANSERLETIPHRKYLDLAVAYYLDMDMEMELAGQKASIEVTNELMGIWGTTEEKLYRLGMGKLLADGGCHVAEITSLIRKIARENHDEETEQLIDELEQEEGIKAGMYVASNQKRFFGASCMLATPLLQELAARMECDLILYPSSVNEVIILLQKDGNRDRMGTRDIQEINSDSVPREEQLSNSIYLYERETGILSLYKEGEPL